jgi:hypothetical protein
MRADPRRSSSYAGEDFSFVLGGPLFQLLRRAHLSGDGLELVRTRIVVIVGLVWVPLLVLSALEGKMLGSRVAVPFLLDADVNVRFLVALPLLIASERVVHQRMRLVVPQFRERRLVADEGWSGSMQQSSRHPGCAIRSLPKSS